MCNGQAAASAVAAARARTQRTTRAPARTDAHRPLTTPPSRFQKTTTDDSNDDNDDVTGVTPNANVTNSTFL